MVECRTRLECSDGRTDCLTARTDCLTARTARLTARIAHLTARMACLMARSAEPATAAPTVVLNQRMDNVTPIFVIWDQYSLNDCRTRFEFPAISSILIFL